MQFLSKEVGGQFFCPSHGKTSSTTWKFPQDSRKLQAKLGTENCSTRSMGNVCQNVSPRLTGVFCSIRSNESACLLPVLKLLSAFCSFRFLLLLFFSEFAVTLLFAAVLKFFVPLTTSSTVGAVNSKMSAPTNFAPGKTYWHNYRIAVLPLTCASASNTLARCRPLPL